LRGSDGEEPEIFWLPVYLETELLKSDRSKLRGRMQRRPVVYVASNYIL